MEKVLTKEEINIGRQKELDAAKGLAIIFMVLVHVYEVYGESVEGTTFSKIVEFLGSPPAAPIFMFLLGVGIVYSKRSTSQFLFKKGIKLFILGYALNFIRDTIPCMILAKRYNDVSYAAEGWDSLFGIDILAFAGLVFIFFALIKKFRIKNEFLIVFWCLFTALGVLLKEVSFDSHFLNSIFGLIWGTDDYSWFPFVSWIFYPILGYIFGQAIIRCINKDVFYKRIFAVSVSLSLTLWICAYENNIRFGAFGDLYQTEYYHHDILGNIILGVFVLMWISIVYFITKYIPNFIQKYLTRWSKYCNTIYCVHWILLGYSMLFLEETYGVMQLFAIFIIVLILNDMIISFLNLIRSYNLRALSKKLKYQA